MNVSAYGIQKRSRVRWNWGYSTGNQTSGKASPTLLQAEASFQSHRDRFKAKKSGFQAGPLFYDSDLCFKPVVSKAFSQFLCVQRALLPATVLVGRLALCVSWQHLSGSGCLSFFLLPPL